MQIKKSPNSSWHKMFACVLFVYGVIHKSMSQTEQQLHFWSAYVYGKSNDLNNTQITIATTMSKLEFTKLLIYFIISVTERAEKWDGGRVFHFPVFISFFPSFVDVVK